jgi:hypothetical protein
MLALACAYLVSLISAVLSEDQRLNLYFDPQADISYAVNLEKQFFNDERFITFTDNTSKPLSPKSTFEIAPPISNSTKMSHSLMFWPPKGTRVSEPNCMYTMGLHGLGNSVMYHNLDLVNSMTYFEVIGVKDEHNQAASAMHFLALVVDKTSKDYRISRQIESQHPIYLEDGYRCDQIIYFGSNKTYVFCWKRVEHNEEGSKVYKLDIMAIVWDPRKGARTNKNNFFVRLEPGNETLFGDMLNKTLSLQVELCRSLSLNQFEVAIFFKTTPFFMIVRYSDDKFNQYIFPVEHRTKASEEVLLELKMDTDSVRISSVVYIDDYKFIVKEYSPNFNGLNPSTYGGAYYFDGAMPKILFIGKGIVLAFKKGTDSQRKPALEDVSIITDCSPLMFDAVENKNYSEISIQIKKHYLGSFYGEKKFKIKSYGRPQYFKGFSSDRYIVYIDQEDGISESPCNKIIYYTTRIYLALPNKPQAIKLLIKFDEKYKNPMRVLVSLNNNLLYLRFPYKLEVFNIDHLMVDLRKESSFVEVANKSRSIEVKCTKTKPDLSDPTTRIQSGKEILRLNTCPPEKDNLYVTLKDRMNKNPGHLNETAWKIERKFKYKYPFLFSYLDINGNFISFESDPMSLPKAAISSFEVQYMKTQDEIYTMANISSIYGMASGRVKYVLISYKNNLGNIIFKLNSSASTYQKHMTLYDNRYVTSLQEINNDRYLIHIEGLLYDLNLLNNTIDPVFKSNDLCGEVYTQVYHNEFGQLTVCGGNDRISIFKSNQEEDVKVDLSSPLTNFMINPSLAQALRTESIKSLFSSPDLNNRFGSMSRIMTASSSSISSNLNSSSSVKIRIFEIGSSRQSIDVFAESVLEVTFKETASIVLPYILNNRLVLLVRFPRVMSQTTARITEEERIYVYIIDSACKLILEKTIVIPDEFDTDLEENKPLATYLPVNKTLQTKVFGQKLLIMFTVKKQSKDILQHFDFFDFDEFDQSNPTASQRQKLIGVLDANQTSADCIKILQLPDHFETVSFGPYFLADSDFIYGLGALVVGMNGKEQRIYLMNDHSLVVDFNMLHKSFDDYMTSAEVWNYSYHYRVRNHLTNRDKNVTMHIDINPVLNVTYNISSDPLSKFEVDLSNSNEPPKIFSFLKPDPQHPNRMKDVLHGMPYEFKFEYDSKIEEMSKQVEASLKLHVSQYTTSKIQDLMKVLKKVNPPISKQRLQEASESLRYDWINLNAVDYIDILYLSSHIGTPRVILEKKNTQVQPNPHLAGKRRCKKFFYQEKAGSEIEEEMLACLGLSSNIDYLNLYIFDERSEDAYLYDESEPVNPVYTLPYNIQETPIDNLYLSATMNYVVLEFANKRTLVTYRYEIFRVKKPRPNSIEVSLIYSGFLWNSQLTFANFYYFLPDLKKTVERFCSVSVVKIDKPLLSYYCVHYDPEKGSFANNPVIIEKDVFTAFRVEDIDSVSPLMNIYTKSLNPLADKTSIEYDPRLYVVITFQTSFTVFLSIDPINPQADFTFSFFCNPFEGYYFLGEEQVVSGQYLAKVGVRFTETYVLFYNVPPVYGSQSSQEYPLFYTVSQLKEAFETDQLLTCIEPTFVKNLQLEVDSVFALNFYRGTKSRKPETQGSTVTYSLVGDRNDFKINSLSLQMIVAANRFKDYYRVEYMPAFEVKTASQLVLSNSIKVNIKGMRNKTGEAYIFIKSGGFFQPGFFFIYMAPLVVLVVGLIFINWLLRCIFSNQGLDDAAAESLPSIVKPNTFANSIVNLKKRVSVNSPKRLKDQEINEHQVKNNLKRSIEMQWIKSEAIMTAKRRKEVMSLTSPMLEVDLTQEIHELARFRSLRDSGRLKVDLGVEDDEQEEEEELMEIPAISAEEYVKFKEFMEEEEKVENDQLNYKARKSTRIKLGEALSFDSESSSSTPSSHNNGSQSSEDDSEASEDDEPKSFKDKIPLQDDYKESIVDPENEAGEMHEKEQKPEVTESVNDEEIEHHHRATERFEVDQDAEDHL